MFRDHYVCVAAKHSPLALRQLSLADIALQPQIVVSPSRANFCDAVDVWFEAAGLKRNVIISVPCFSLLPGYIEKTDAIAFLPSRELPNDKLTQLALIEKPIEAVDFEVVAAWHTRSGQDPLHNWVIGLLKQEYAR